jgi:hypothetical protein
MPPSQTTRYGQQQYLSGLDYLRRYGTPSAETTYIDDYPDSRLPHAVTSDLVDDSDSDSMPDLVSVVDTTDDEMDCRWRGTKMFPEDLATWKKRMMTEKKRKMVRDRIDEKKRGKLLKVA